MRRLSRSRFSERNIRFQLRPAGAGTLRGDYYWQGLLLLGARLQPETVPYDRLRGYTNVNLTLILTSQDGWQGDAL